MDRICIVCHEVFKTPYSFQKYCSSDCRKVFFSKKNKEYYQKTHNLKEFQITCDICKKKFISNRPQAKYCSDECRKKGNQIKNKRNQRLIHNWIEQEIPCEICQKPFVKVGNSKTCPECREKWGLKKRKEALTDKGTTPDQKVKTVRCTAQVMTRCYYGGRCAGLPCCDYCIKEPRLDDKTESRLRGCPSWACDKYISKRAAERILKDKRKSK